MKKTFLKIIEFSKKHSHYIVLMLFLLPLILYVMHDRSIHNPDCYGYYMRVLKGISAAHFNVFYAIWRGLISPDIQSPFMIALMTPVVFIIEKWQLPVFLSAFSVIAIGFICLAVLYRLFIIFSKDKWTSTLLAILCLSNMVFFYMGTRLFTEMLQALFIIVSLYSAIRFMKNPENPAYAIYTAVILLFSVSVKISMPVYQIAPLIIVGYTFYSNGNIAGILRRSRLKDILLLGLATIYFVYWFFYLKEPQSLRASASYLYWMTYLSPKESAHILESYIINPSLYPDKISWLQKISLQMGFFFEKYGIQYFLITMGIVITGLFSQNKVFRKSSLNVAIWAILINLLILIVGISLVRCNDARLIFTTTILHFILLGLGMLLLFNRKSIVAISLISIIIYLLNLYVFVTKVDPIYQEESFKTRQYIYRILGTMENFVTIGYDNYYMIWMAHRSAFTAAFLRKSPLVEPFKRLPEYYSIKKAPLEEAFSQLIKETRGTSKPIIIYNWKAVPRLKHGYTSIDDLMGIQYLLDNPRNGYAHDSRLEASINYEGIPYFFIYENRP